MDIVAHHYADLDDLLIHYVTAGTGPPVGCRLNVGGNR